MIAKRFNVIALKYNPFEIIYMNDTPMSYTEAVVFASKMMNHHSRKIIIKEENQSIF